MYAASKQFVLNACVRVIRGPIFDVSCSTQRETVLSLATEIDGYKKAIQKEQETHEQFTLQINKAEADCIHVNKQMELSKIKQERLKEEYMSYTRTLQETEQALLVAKTVSTYLPCYA